MLKKDWIVIKFSTLKQTPVILKIFPLECISNRVSIYICLQSNKYVKFIEWMSEDSIFTLIIAIQMNKSPENSFILFIIILCKYWSGEKRRKNS